jgi:hypothetical protein
MPKLPDASMLGERPRIVPKTGVQSFNPNTGFETAPGKALGQLAGTIEVASKEIERANLYTDKIRAEDAFNKIREQEANLRSGDDGFVNRRGEDAATKPVVEDYTKRFDIAAEQIANGLGNDRQKEFFRQRAAISRLQFSQDLLNHVTREKDQFETGVYKSTIDLEMNNAVDRYQDPAGIGLSIERMTNAINQEGDRKGWSKEQIDATRSNVVSKTNRGIVERMLANNEDIAASNYYKANKKLINGDDAIALEKSLEIGNTRVLAQTFADEVDAAGMTEADAIKKARKTLSGQQEDAAVLAVKQRFNERTQAIAGAQAAAADTAWDILAKTKRLDAVPPAVLNKMDGKVRLALEKEAQNIVSGASVKTDPNTYYDLQTMAVREPEKFQQADLRQYFDKLDQSDREHFIKMQRPDSLADAATLSQQLSNMHDQMGWGSSDKDKKGLFDKSVTLAVEEEQRKRGGKLSFKERQEVIDRMVIDGEVVSGKWYQADPNKKLFQVFGTEDAKKFVPTIPDNDRKSLVDRFKARGVNKPSDAQIMQAYRKWKGL